MMYNHAIYPTYDGHNYNLEKGLYMKTKRGQKWLCGVGTLAVCFMLTGCGHEHTLTEANYQQAATCEVCGATVGEPLQANFEKFGLECNAEQNIEYPIVYSFNSDIPMKVEVGGVVFSDYEVFDSDDTHEALEGYEWRAITMTLSLNMNNVSYLNHENGYLPNPYFTDYYCNFDNTYNESTDTYTLNYNGVDYTDVKGDSEILQDDVNGDIHTIKGRVLHRVPKGYDGLVATVIDASKWDDKGNLTDPEQFYDDNPFFRLK